MDDLSRRQGNASSSSRECGFDRLFKLEPVHPTTNNTLVYIIPAVYEYAKTIVDHVKAIVSHVKQTSFSYIRKIHVILVPRKLFLIEKLFEEEGIAGNTELHDLNLNFVPWDVDLMSLEMPYFYSKTFIDMDQSYLLPIAVSLSNLQSVYGVFPEPMAFGRLSCIVSSMMKSQNQSGGEFMQKKFEQVFLFDRDIDYPSVLLTQMTYEGLVDELLEINCGYLVTSDGGKMQNYALNSVKDEVFSTVSL